MLEAAGQLTGMVGSVEYALAEARLDVDGGLWQPPDLGLEEGEVLEQPECSAPFRVMPYLGRYSVPGTTPRGLHLQKLAAGMRDRGATCAVVECSTQALAAGDCDWLDVTVAVHTGLLGQPPPPGPSAAGQPTSFQASSASGTEEAGAGADDSQQAPWQEGEEDPLEELRRGPAGGASTSAPAGGGGGGGGLDLRRSVARPPRALASTRDVLAAQLRLFDKLIDGGAQTAVVNLDDPSAEQALRCAARVPVVTYGIDNAQADVVATGARFTIWEAQLEVRTPLGTLSIVTPLLGKHNVYNVLAAVATGVALKVGKHGVCRRGRGGGARKQDLA